MGLATRLAVTGLLAVLVAATTAQSDRITLGNGTVVADVKVTAFDLSSLKFTRGGATEQMPSDQVAKLELGAFPAVYRRVLRDPDAMLKVARERLAAKDLLLAQFGFVAAAVLFFENDAEGRANGALDEMQKAMPDAGLLPEVYRLPFEHYRGRGAKAASEATEVAKKYVRAAAAGSWPSGFANEAELLLVIAESKDAPSLQTKLRVVIGKVAGIQAVVADRAHIELAHSLRESKDVQAAQRIYEDVRGRVTADESARAGAMLGLGKILLETAAAGDRDAGRQAMLCFLRVHLETKGAWPRLRAEALYHAILAADKWRGPEFGVVMGRCKRVLVDEFASTEWAVKVQR